MPPPNPTSSPFKGCHIVEKDSNLQDPDWWQNSIMYHVYLRSFADSNGDGIGDLPGLISKLDYLTYLGVNLIYLSPIYPSPMRDCGYDITDFKAIDPVYGTLEDFDQLVAELHRRGIRIAIDWIPNHTSDRHPFFLESSKSRDNLYSDYYIWHDGHTDNEGKRIPPNNWLSTMSGPAWTYCAARDQYYYHQFTADQPDLNFRNPKVVEEIESSMRFWLDRGIDGLRIDAIKHLYESENVHENEDVVRWDLPDFHYESIRHSHTVDRPEVHETMQRWRSILDEYRKRDGIYRCMLPEIYEDWETGVDECMKYYGSGSDAPFCMRLIARMKGPGQTSCHLLKQIIEEWYHKTKGYGLEKLPIWATSNHDNKRAVDRYGSQYADAFNALLLLLPGIPCIYYGEELGLQGKELSFEETLDHQCKHFGPDHYLLYARDSCRCPMAWNSSANGGFCSEDAKPWLPVHENYIQNNVEIQQKNEGSTLNFFRRLLKLRERPEFSTRGLFNCGYTTDNLLTIIRQAAPSDWKDESAKDFGFRYDVLLNFGVETEYFDAPSATLFFHNGECFPDVHNGPETPRIILHSKLDADQQDSVAKFPFQRFEVRPGQVFIIQSRPMCKPCC